MQADSVDKIVTHYLAAITRQPFEYGGKMIEPKALIVSPLIFRAYTCPPICAGCCPVFSLDYLPADNRPESGRIQPRSVVVNGARIEVYSDRQRNNRGRFCQHVDMATGRCGIHGAQPFSCDFEVLRFTHYPDRALLMTRLFGRGWNMLRVDGQRGARCEIISLMPDTKADILRRLRRLSDWADHFGLASHWMPEVLEWVANGPHNSPLTLKG